MKLDISNIKIEFCGNDPDMRRCQRCWKWHDTHNSHDDLCDRCVIAMLINFPDHPETSHIRNSLVNLPHVNEAISRWCKKHNISIEAIYGEEIDELMLDIRYFKSRIKRGMPL